MKNVLQQEIDVYEYIYPKASIIPYYEDERACFDSLLNLSTKMIVASRELTDQEQSYLKSKDRQVRQSRIAVDALALIVNPANNIDQMSTTELAEILSGKETEWNNVWPNDGLGRIEVVFDHQGSSTVQFMRDSLLNGAELGSNVFAQKSSEDVFKAVAANKNAIGVIGVSWISTDMATANMSTEERAAALTDSVGSAPRPAVPQGCEGAQGISPRSGKRLRPLPRYIYTGDYPSPARST